jgi:hypothetical protein
MTRDGGGDSRIIRRRARPDNGGARRARVAGTRLRDVVRSIAGDAFDGGASFVRTTASRSLVVRRRDAANASRGVVDVPIWIKIGARRPVARPNRRDGFVRF